MQGTLIIAALVAAKGTGAASMPQACIEAQPGYIDCIDVADIERMLAKADMPIGGGDIADALEELGSEAGIRKGELLVLGTGGKPTHAATADMGRSLKAGSVTRARAKLRPLQLDSRPPEKMTSIGVTGDCPGPTWNHVTYYGRDDNVWCDMRTSEADCGSCCDTKMAWQTSVVAAFGATCIGSVGWTGWGAVGCAIATAASTAALYVAARRCLKGCRQRFECCVDSRGTILQTDTQIRRNRLTMADWTEGGRFSGVLWWDACADRMTVQGNHNGERVEVVVDYPAGRRLAERSNGWWSQPIEVTEAYPDADGTWHVVAAELLGSPVTFDARRYCR